MEYTKGNNMSEQPYVSVVIPTYNRADLLKRAIESVQKQTYKKWELIIVDDNSSDNTEEIVSEIRDPRIRYVKNNKNLGAAASRNRGVVLANYELVAFQDSDDVCHQNKVEKQVSYMKQYSEYDIVYSGFVNHHIDGTNILVPNHQLGIREGNLFPTLLVNNVIGAPTILIKRSLFLENGGFDIDLRALEDWDFVLRVSEKNKIGFVSEVLVDAYETEGSISFDGVGYYDARCKMLASHYKEAQKFNIFDELVNDLFKKAEKQGILEMVKNIFVKYLEMYITEKG